MRTMKKENLIKRLEKVKKELIRINQGQEALLIEQVLLKLNEPLETLEAPPQE